MSSSSFGFLLLLGLVCGTPGHLRGGGIPSPPEGGMVPGEWLRGSADDTSGMSGGAGDPDTAAAPGEWETTQGNPAGSDTTASGADSIAAQRETPSGIDSVVTYTAADSIVYSLTGKTMSLFGKGNLRYRQMGLRAERIHINWDTALLDAAGVPDPDDTTGTAFLGLPDLADGGESYKGRRVGYNFRTKQGRIELAATEIQEGYYYGEAIKKVTEEDLFVAHGRYTTCDLEHPHYYFASPEMKVTLQDKVVARPVYLYVSDVPVFALPFGIFPTQRGRRSGVIGPAYGESARGRYLLHLGYYWAMSDYTDISLRADGYTKGSWVLYSDLQYALRYAFTGAVRGSYATTVTGEPGDPDYARDRLFNLRLNHNQEFNPTTRLVADMTFTSGSFYRQTSNNLNDLLRQNVISNATLTKSWEGTPNSMTLNVRRDQNLQSGELREVLPGIGFNRGQTFPFRSRSAAAGEGGDWYELIGYTYGAQFLNSRNKTLGPDGDFRREDRRGVNHLVTVNASPRLGHVTVTPFFNYTEKWYDRSIRREFKAADSTVAETELRAIKAVRYFDLGLAASTKLYGIFHPPIPGVTGIRHQVTPSISYTYQPDFSRPGWGYYGRYRDAAGSEVRYGFYEQEVFGGAPSEERQAVAVRIGNVFEMKASAPDTSSRENKYQLLNLDVGTSYNFARDSLRFDELALGYRTSVGQVLSIGGSSRFNLYKFEPYADRPQTGRRVNRFLLAEEGRLAQLTSFTLSVSTSLSGEKTASQAGPEISPEDSIRRAERRGVVDLYEEAPVDFSIPWNLQLSWNFTQSQADPRVKVRSSNLSASLGFNLTEFWKIQATASYDILMRQVAAPQISVYRDLHCWEMDFNWVPTGQYRNFRVEVRLKAPQLQDVKVTKQRSARDIF
ncbi:MAG: putative LPS assembly protein LptD [Bacteroidota bacterium]